MLKTSGKIIDITTVCSPSKECEAECVYGTQNKEHAGVKALFENTNPKYIGGSLTKINDIHHYDFRDLRLSPEQMRKFFNDNNWDKIIGLQTRNPIQRAHFEIIKNSHTEHGANVLIHPAVGPTKAGDINYISRVRTYKVVQQK